MCLVLYQELHMINSFISTVRLQTGYCHFYFVDVGTEPRGGKELSQARQLLGNGAGFESVYSILGWTTSNCSQQKCITVIIRKESSLF